MSEVQQLARRQQRVEELCAGAIRALSGEADLHFRGRRLHRGRQRLPLFAPHLHPAIESDDFGSFRGAADGLALRLSLSDAALHARLCPPDPVERLVFELLEQMRVESLAPQALQGVAHNLRHRFEQWSLAFHRSRLTDSARGILLYTVAQVCRARVTGEPVLEETEDLMEATRAALAPAMGSDLAGLRRQRQDQAAYAVHALGIARLVGEMLHSADDEDDDHADSVDAEDSERAAFGLVMELDASVEERARRRWREVRARGEAAEYEPILASMRRRDKIDSQRAVSPLRAAADAVVVDTTDMDIEEALAEAGRLVEERRCPAA